MYLSLITHTKISNNIIKKKNLNSNLLYVNVIIVVTLIGKKQISKIALTYIYLPYNNTEVDRILQVHTCTMHCLHIYIYIYIYKEF